MNNDYAEIVEKRARLIMAGQIAEGLQDDADYRLELATLLAMLTSIHKDQREQAKKRIRQICRNAE